MRIAGWTKQSPYHWEYKEGAIKTKQVIIVDIIIIRIKVRNTVIGYHVFQAKHKYQQTAQNISDKDQKKLTITAARKLAYKWMKTVSRDRKRFRVAQRKLRDMKWD